MCNSKAQDPINREHITLAELEQLERRHGVLLQHQLIPIRSTGHVVVFLASDVRKLLSPELMLHTR